LLSKQKLLGSTILSHLSLSFLPFILCLKSKFDFFLGLPAFLVGVPRQLAGRVFRFNLFYLAKRRIKKGFPLQPLTQIELQF